MSRNNAAVDLNRHHQPSGLSDRVAFRLRQVPALLRRHLLCQALRPSRRRAGDRRRRARHGRRTLNHLKCLRRMQDDRGWIKTLMDEAENERMHLMTFIAVAKPTWFERCAGAAGAGGVLSTCFFVLYLVCTPHRAPHGRLFRGRGGHQLHPVSRGDRRAGRHRERAGAAHRHRLLEPRAGCARCATWCIAVRADEAGHRDVNHGFADQLSGAAGPSPAVA